MAKPDESLDIASHGRLRLEDCLKESFNILAWLSKEKALDDEDKNRFAEAKGEVKEALAYVNSTKFKDSEAVKWLRKRAKQARK